MDASLHIGAFIVEPGGEVALYTKQRLGAFSPDVAPWGSVPPPESTIFEPGGLNPLVVAGGRTAGVAICADIGDAGHPRRAAARGIDTYLASMFVIPSDYETDTARLAEYARTHGLLRSPCQLRLRERRAACGGP